MADKFAAILRGEGRGVSARCSEEDEASKERGSGLHSAARWSPAETLMNHRETFCSVIIQLCELRRVEQQWGPGCKSSRLDNSPLARATT